MRLFICIFYEIGYNMKLYYNNTSPYARKVRIVLYEKGLLEKANLELINPREAPENFRSLNPLGMIPTLITDDGISLYDSPVICEYLDDSFPEPQLIPKSGADRWTVLKGEALCDGMLDCAFSIVMELRRQPEQQSPEWLERWTSTIFYSLNDIENKLSDFQGALTLAQINLGVTLGYISFRLNHLQWRDKHPELTKWFSEFSKRPSMSMTHPELTS